MNHPPIVVAGSADGLNLVRIVPGEENELSIGLQGNAPDPVGPERENVMHPGETKEFAPTLLRMRQIVIEGHVNGLSIYCEDEGRGHDAFITG